MWPRRFAPMGTIRTTPMPVLPTDITVRTGLWVESLSARVRGITDSDIRIMAADFTVAGLVVARMKDTGSLGRGFEGRGPVAGFHGGGGYRGGGGYHGGGSSHGGGGSHGGGRGGHALTPFHSKIKIMTADSPAAGRFLCADGPGTLCEAECQWHRLTNVKTTCHQSAVC